MPSRLISWFKNNKQLKHQKSSHFIKYFQVIANSLIYFLSFIIRFLLINRGCFSTLKKVPTEIPPHQDFVLCFVRETLVLHYQA